MRLEEGVRWVAKLIPWWERKEEKKFPCKTCLLYPTCSKVCEKIERDNDKVRTFIKQHKCCPDCGSLEFFEGPSGGGSTNFKCAGCGHWFNIGYGGMFIERIRL